jgi:hypothetical protein
MGYSPFQHSRKGTGKSKTSNTFPHRKQEESVVPSPLRHLHFLVRHTIASGSSLEGITLERRISRLANTIRMYLSKLYGCVAGRYAGDFFFLPH